MGNLVGGLRGLRYGARAKLNKSVQLAFACVFLGAAAQAEPVTIVALGDSLTAGYGLPEGQGFVPQLQGWLDTQGVEARIVNAGVSGDTTAGGLARLDWALSDDVDAMILALGGNDLLRGIPPSASRANLEAILAEVSGARGLPVLIVGLEAPGNYGPAFKEAFDAMYPELADSYDALHEVSFLGPLVAEVDMATARARYMQADGIHPNRDGVGVIVDTIGPRVVELAGRATP